MKFADLCHIFSVARVNRYLYASKNDKRRAVRLYKQNLHLCQQFYGVLNIFEVLLRNAINEHYIKYFNDSDWIINQAAVGKLLENNIREVLEAEKNFRNDGIYSPDRMASSFTLGFWTYMFSKNKYRLGGKSLLQIFPKRDKGTTQKKVYQDLTRIRDFRNRIAHHEPIIFDFSNSVNLNYATETYAIIARYIRFLGYDSDYVLAMAERPDKLLKKI